MVSMEIKVVNMTRESLTNCILFKRYPRKITRNMGKITLIRVIKTIIEICRIFFQNYL